MSDTFNRRPRHPGGPDFDIGGPPMIVPGRSGGAKNDLIVAIQKSGVITALDPERNVAGAVDFVDSGYDLPNPQV
jgi:hypothetical protein